MDPIKESFKRVKEDMDFLKFELDKMRESIIELCEIIDKIAKKEQKIDNIPSSSIPAHNPDNSTIQHIIPAHNMPFKPLNPQNQSFSTGNEGVPADRQTNQQTDISSKDTTDLNGNIKSINQNSLYKEENMSRREGDSIENAAEMLKSLDNLKRELRQKFIKLTEQEMLVFSTIYQFDNEVGFSDYKVLAERLSLTESSIRDYVVRLIKKGIPVEKTKINNKNVHLNISENLKKIASLSTILTLRDS